MSKDLNELIKSAMDKLAYRQGKREGFRQAYDRLAKHLDTRREENRDLRKCLEKTEEALEAMIRKCETLEAELHARG